MQVSDLVQTVFAPLLPGKPSGVSTEEYLVVSAHGTPRWLLPARHRRIDSVLANWSPYRWSSRVGWNTVRAANRMGRLSTLPHVSSCDIAGLDDIDWRSLGWTANDPPVCVVHVGTPGVSRKAVIHLVDRTSGRCGAILKVPLAETAKAAIVREADVLVKLADEGYACAPRLICVDSRRGISVQTVLDGAVGRRRFTTVHSDLLRSLTLPGENTTIVEHAAEWQDQALWAAGCQTAIEVMTPALSELCDTRPLLACWVHGDFAPWNIRHAPDGSAGLLDWEEGRRGGLPLQDAFHFLHNQDYLFGARPKAHVNNLAPLAVSLGITSEQCRRLEIAHLVSSYLQQLTRREFEHADFLLDTLRVVLGDRLCPAPRRVRFSIKRSPDLVQTPAPSASLHIRNELFSAFRARLNSANVPYCILSGYANCSENITSDVDFMVHPRDLDRVAPLLAQAAQNAGGALVQAIPHETGACYFVLAKHEGSQAGYLDPDCSGDYRYRGRLWLSAEDVLARRRQFKNFYVPDVADEFTYYLIKKVLKQAITACQLRRLRHLYQRDPASCRSHLLRFLTQATVRVIEKALVQDDLGWFQFNISVLRSELKASAPVETFRSRIAQTLANLRLWVGRALHPTGMFVLVTGAEKSQRSEFTESLLRALSPAFRRAATIQFDGALPHKLIGSVLRLRVARLQSTLSIGTIGRRKFADEPRSHWLSCLLVRLFLGPDISCEFVSADSQTINIASVALEGNTVHLNMRLSMQENVQQACEAILRWMAVRVEQRLVAESNAGPVRENRVEAAPMVSLE